MAKSGNYDGTKIAAKWAKNLGSSTESIKAGVNAVTVAPGVTAGQRKDAYIQGVQDNVEKWAEKVRAVTLTDWREAMLGKGLGRIASGANAAQDKVTAFWKDFGPFLAQVQTTVNQTPRGDLETNLQRMTTNAREIAKYKQRS